MSLPADVEPVLPQCPACGAVVPADAKTCWLCHDPLVQPHKPAGESPFAAVTQNSWALHAGIWLAVVLCAVVTFGLTLGSNKYYAIGFAIMAGPALVIVLGGAGLGRLLGKPWHPVVKVSVGAAIALVLLPVAFVVSLFILCTDLCTGKL
jgi:hypothetical protein